MASYSAVYRSGHRDVLRVVEVLMPQEPWLVRWFAVLTFEAVCWPMLLVRRQPAGKQAVAIGRALVAMRRGSLAELWSPHGRCALYRRARRLAPMRFRALPAVAMALCTVLS
jgi:hypothetical protein